MFRLRRRESSICEIIFMLCIVSLETARGDAFLRHRCASVHHRHHHTASSGICIHHMHLTMCVLIFERKMQVGAPLLLGGPLGARLVNADECSGVLTGESQESQNGGESWRVRIR